MTSVFSAVGVVLSNALYLNTLPRMLTIFREQALDGFNPVPIMVQAINTVAWLIYGLHVRRAVASHEGRWHCDCAGFQFAAVAAAAH
jgi:uncharacterized protein with PQ loop repeat